MASSRPDGRRKGSIEERGGSLRVAVYAGIDPVTGRRAYERETVKGTDEAAWRKAQNTLVELRAKVLKQQNASSSVCLRYAIDEWFRKAELEDSTRASYAGYINRVIKPLLGDIALKRIGARDLESLYAELRRCRIQCDGKPFIEHKKAGDHDCTESECGPHECNPMAASTVRQIHSIISSTLGAAVRWGWIDTNPAKVAKRPKQKPPEPDPPSPADAARLVDKAFKLSEDWGTLVWLVMTTGMRRAEVAGLRWSNIDLDAEIVEIRRSYVQSNGKGKEKDTKTHQMRRVALDSETVALLRTHKEWCRAELDKINVKLTDDMFVFMNGRAVDLATGRPTNRNATKPYSPRRHLPPLQAHGEQTGH